MNKEFGSSQTAEKTEKRAAEEATERAAERRLPALAARLREFLSRYPEANRVLVGFSGGADSCALLALLTALRSQNGPAVEALHVHHGIRGEAADEDERFCEAFCRERNIPFRAVHADVPALAKAWGISLEAAGRRVRRRCFADALREGNLSFVLTAHHRDDQAETVFLHLLRGCGLEGLRGMRECVPLPDGGRLLRPLLSVSRQELAALCREENIRFRRDESNEDTAFTRNYLRKRVLPLLAEINPAWQDALVRLAILAGTAEDYLQAESLQNSGLPDERLSSLPDPILARILQMRYRQALERFHPAAEEEPALFALPSAAVGRLLCSVRGEGDFSLALPEGVTAERRGTSLFFLPDPRSLPPCVPLRAGKNLLPGGMGILYAEPLGSVAAGENPPAQEAMAGASAQTPKKMAVSLENGEKIYRIVIKYSVSSAILKKAVKDPPELFCRGWKAGDRILKRGKSLPVGELLRRAGVPAPCRRIFPLLCDREGVLWVPGVALRDGAGASAAEKDAVCFTARLPQTFFPH